MNFDGTPGLPLTWSQEAIDRIVEISRAETESGLGSTGGALEISVETMRGLQSRGVGFPYTVTAEDVDNRQKPLRFVPSESDPYAWRIVYPD